MLCRLATTVSLVEVHWCPSRVAHADRQLKCRPSLGFGCAREAHSVTTGAVSPCKTCVRRSHAASFPNKNMSWQFGEGMKRWEWFHQPRGRIRIVSLVCLVMVSLTLHILSGWLLRPLFVSANISVLGVVCFQSREAIFRSVCLRDRSAEATRGFAMAAIGSFHVEVVTS